MMKKAQKKHDISAVAALLLLGIFAVCILSVLLTGAKAYRRLTVRDREAFERRTCAQLIYTKVRQTNGKITVGDFGGGNALILSEEFGEGDYVTRIYCHDGYMMELFAPAEGDYSPEDGERILPAQALGFELDGDIIRVTVENGENTKTELSLLTR